MEQTILDNRYRLGEPLLGSGQMAQVYLARDEVLARDVAVKLLRETYSGDEEFVERFRREAQSAASLTHPNIVSVYDLGRSEEGSYYMAMEYVPGGTLKERISGRGPLDAATAATVALQIAGALREAHGRGIIHRDVKSQNVLVTASADVKVTDFGIARAVSTSRMTRTGLVLGTAKYMSPEQAMGETVGPRSDLYSLGVVLYEMLTGELPFEADTEIAVSIKHINEPPPPPREPNPEIPEEMNALVLKLLSKNPEDRHRDAAELMQDLERVRDNLSAPRSQKTEEIAIIEAAHQAGRKEQREDAGKRQRKPLRFAALFAAILLLGAGALYLLQSSQESPRWLAPLRGLGGGAAEAPGIAVESVFVHRATPANIFGNSTYIDGPVLNGNPDAIVSATQNWNPGNSNGIYNDHPVGVWYDRSRGQWAIFNQDRAPMPEGAAFNVLVIRGSPQTE